MDGSRRVFIVLGMHRSGTSAVVRALQCLGVELGDHLSGPSSDNPKGFFEDACVVALNTRLLAEFGLTWHSLASVPYQQWSSPALLPFQREAAEIVASHLGSGKQWAFKDPRTARLLPFWKHVFDDADIRTAYVFVTRHPECVAVSLNRRNGFSAMRSHLLWLSHTLLALRDTAGAPVAFVDYDGLMSSPREVLLRLRHELPVPSGLVSRRAIDQFADQFIDPSLCHCLAPDDEELPQDAIGLLARQVHAALVRAAEGQGPPEDAQRKDWLSTLAGWEPLLPHLEDSWIRCDSLQSRNDEEAEYREHLTSDLGHLRRRLMRRESEHVTLLERLRHTECLLNAERLTVLKPVVRTLYRACAGAASRLPSRLYQSLRTLKSRVHPAPIAPDVTASGPLPHRGRANEGHAPRDGLRTAFVRQALACRSEGYDVVVFPVIDWAYRIQRPQHLSRELAKLGHRVFYLTTTFSSGGTPGGWNIVDSPAEGVFLCQLDLPGKLPSIYRHRIDPVSASILADALCDMFGECHVDQVAAIVDLATWLPVAERLPGATLVYDCMDYHGGFSTNGPAVLEAESRLLERADLLVTSSEPLACRLTRNGPTVLIRNGVEVAHFGSKHHPLPEWPDGPVVGYVGAVSEWFDVTLLAEAARRYTDWTFVIVGACHLCDTSDVATLPNVLFVGEVLYDDVPRYLQSFDVCILPFLDSELTRCTNPVKVYEYLAAGKPVVSTDIPEVRRMGDLVHCTSCSDDFLTALQAAHSESMDDALAAKRRRSVGACDWSARAVALDEAVATVHPLASVVVLTHNGLDFTRACLASLERFTLYPNWELIVVDNGSSDGTEAFLDEYETDHPNVRVILNGANFGFAAGNNVGLAAARGKYLVVLNNDTYVTRGWLAGLIRHLRIDESLGLIGPVTNNIGNEAKIPIAYSDMEEMASKANKYTASHLGQRLTLATAAFFCAAMRRDLFERVGPLDERFGLGFFEDDDYCNRVREAGFSVAVAEDVFVHHHLSASFDGLGQDSRRELFEKNRSLYEQKWGPWSAHQYREGTS